ncbi:hypothetical protein [Halanaerobium sp. DL-01]|uniref:hypothetical protein n=1 Tax=Halanaerobium sp. DL-01 TaxID=1653064 RepID=UPI0013148003|nr:hypothetical protein [Halanaerobium sp. DL-01]
MQNRILYSLILLIITETVDSTASTVKEAVDELKTGKFSNIAERDQRKGYSMMVR